MPASTGYYEQTLTTTDGSTAVLFDLPLDDESGYDCLLEVLGKDQASGDAAFYTRRFRILRTGGVASFVGSIVTPIPDQLTNGGWGGMSAPSIGGGTDLLIQVAGMNGVNIDWLVYFEYAEI